MVFDPWNDKERKKRAEVDRPIKSAISLLHQMRLLRFELVAHEGRDAGFDAPGAERDQGQAGVKADQFAVKPAREIAARQHAVSSAVKERHPQDGVIAADQFVRQPGAQQRHEIIGGNKRMNNGRGRIGILSQTALEHRAGDVAREDAPHPVIAEAFARFVADDVFDLGGKARALRCALAGWRLTVRHRATNSI